MTLWAYPMDDTGCGNYRMRWPLEQLAEHRGLDVRVVTPGSDEGFTARLNTRREVTHVQVPEGCTGLFIQRPTSEILIDTLTKLKRVYDLPLICDVDDDLSSLSARHPAFHHLHPKSSGRMPGHSAQAVHAACALADIVTASTPALLERYAKHGRGVVLENRLPPHLVSAIPPHTGPSSQTGATGGREDPSHTGPRVGRVGWPGSLITHPDDLSPALPALHRNRVQPLFCLGPHPHPRHIPPAQRRRLPYPHMVFSGRIEFADWLPYITAHMDVGIAPLEQSRFNEAKSWLKPLELACAGVPAVISDTTEYRALITPSTNADGSRYPGMPGALLARKPNHWTAHLRTLLNDPDARAELRHQGYVLAAANTYDRPRVLDEWASVFRPWCEPKAKTPAAQIAEAAEATEPSDIPGKHDIALALAPAPI